MGSKNTISRLYIWLHMTTYKWLCRLMNIFGWEEIGTVMLCYHNIGYDNDKYTITPEEFKKQLEILQSKADFIELKSALTNTRLGIDRPKLTLSFDDGYEGIYKYALPILKHMGIKATIFVLAEPENANRNSLVNRSNLMDFSQIKDLLAEGWTIGCHGATHTPLDTDDAKLHFREIVLAKQKLESGLEVEIDYFAYPRGFYSKKLENLVAYAGYEAGFGIGVGQLDTNQSKFHLPRLIVDKSLKLPEFEVIVSGTYHRIREVTDQLHLGRLRWL